MGDADASDADLNVDGQVIEEFAGLVDWNAGEDSTYNEAPAGVAYGFNFRRRANKVQFSIRVRGSSKSVKYLDGLVGKRAVPILAQVVRNLETYQVDQQIALGCERGVLQPGTRSIGAGDIEEVSYAVIGIGPIELFKAE